MERRRLGRTDHHSSVAVLGGAAAWSATVEEAGAFLQLALDHGVNHLDIAPQYGAAESVVGPHLAAHRGELFIAGKTLRANPDGVTEQFDTTRRLLNAEVLDLYQAHAVTTLEELDRRSPALERILELRDAGHTRFAGITGHDLEVPRAHLEALRRFDLDTVMFPVYPALWARPEYREPAEELLATCAERDVGVMVIKAVARRPWADRRPLADAVAGELRHGGPLGRLVVRAPGHRRRDRPRRALRALDAGRARVLHAGRHGAPAPRARRGRALRRYGRRRAPRRGRGDGGRGAHLPHAALKAPGSGRLQRRDHGAEGAVVGGARRRGHHDALAEPGEAIEQDARAARRRCRTGRGCRAPRRRARSPRSSQRSWRIRSRSRGPSSVQPWSSRVGA